VVSVVASKISIYPPTLPSFLSVLPPGPLSAPFLYSHPGFFFVIVSFKDLSQTMQKTEIGPASLSTNNPRYVENGARHDVS